MELERVGPLSYDVTAPDLDPSAQRGIVFGLLATFSVWVVAVVGGWFLLGYVSDARWVHRGFPLGMVAIAVGAAAVGSRRTLRRARRTALLVTLAISCGASLLAFNTLRNVKPAIPQVRSQIDAIELPPGFTVISEETRGDRFCRRGCPRVDRVYAVPANDPDPVKTMVLAMFAQGWRNPSDVPPELATTAERGVVFVQLGEKDGHVVELTASRQS